ncbi:MAG TPA: hypothetical protein VJ385_00400, partial [Fibrobacteria bacterium]|nr:hypothetical protein [Fibrobacteria bacterium]
MELKSLTILVLKLSIFLTVLAVALGTSPRNATYMFRNPGALARSLIPMSLIMPLFAVVLVMAFRLNPAVEIALVALSLSPVPPFLPKKILKAGGREDYTIGLLVSASVLSVLLIPAALGLLDKLFPASLHMAPSEVLPVVLSSVLAPLALGLLFHALAPRSAAKAARLIGGVASALLLLGLIPLLLGSFRSLLSLLGDGTLLSMTVFCLVGLAAGHAFGQREAGKQVILAFCTASWNPGVALAIA